MSILIKVKNRLSVFVEKSTDSLDVHHRSYASDNAFERESRVVESRNAENFADSSELGLTSLLSKSPSLSRKVAVDIGAGTGWLSLWLAQRFEKVIAIEPSPAAEALAKRIFSGSCPNIEWHVAQAQNLIPSLQLNHSTLFVTARVLSHLPDRVVAQILQAVTDVAPPGSAVSFAEIWGKPYAERLWHVRDEGWWSAVFGSSWQLEFLQNRIQSDERYVGIHGVKRF